MADERRFFAGDLGTQHLQQQIEVEAPDVEVRGELVEVHHALSAVNLHRPVTVVRLKATGATAMHDHNPPTFVLDPNWTVRVAPPAPVDEEVVL